MSQQDSQDDRRRAPDAIALGPALLLFVGLVTHILVLIFAAAVLAVSVWRAGRATRVWGSILLVVALLAGVALWKPLPVLNPGKTGAATEFFQITQA